MKSFIEYINEASKKEDPAVQRLQYIGSMLNKYKHTWGENPSRRMYGWVDEYNEIKANNRPAWEAHCKKHGFSLSHNAYDCLA